jgi:PAS domain S-box-containing protein
MAKGPIDKLTVKLNEFMAEIETQTEFAPGEMEIIQTGGVYPRRDAMELLQALKFHQAVIGNMGVGVVVVDTDARILNVNAAGYEIMGRSATEVINSPVIDIFPASVKPKLGDALKRVFQLSERSKISFLADFEDRCIRTTVSAILLSGDKVGWVLVLEDSDRNYL